MPLEPAKDSVDVLIFVSDITKALAFYQGALGLEKTRELQTPFGVAHWLRFGTSSVKLMDPKVVPPAGPIGLEKQLGVRYLSFTIRGLTRLCAQLREQRVEFTVPETQVTPDLHIAMVKDPDGNIVQFVEGE